MSESRPESSETPTPAKKKRPLPCPHCGKSRSRERVSAEIETDADVCRGVMNVYRERIAMNGEDAGRARVILEEFHRATEEELAQLLVADGWTEDEALACARHMEATR